MYDRARRRPSLRALLIGAALALMAGGVLLLQTAPEPERVAAAGEAAALRKVGTQRVRALPTRSRAEVAGVLEARRRVQLYAETRGPVMAVGAEELDRVEAGQELVAIDPLLAEVAVERAEAAVTRTRSQLALARSHLERLRSLAERGVVSPSDLDDAVNGEKVAAALLRESLAERVRARDELTKKKIAAPFAGVLRSFPVEVGEYVHEGQQLAELLDLETVRVTIGLSDREVVALHSGQRADVQVEAYAEERFEGTILRVGAAADPVHKKFPVEIELPNAGGRLLPGMLARVSLELGESEPRKLIPRDATVDEFGLRFVYRLEAEAEGGPLVARRRRIAVRSLPFRPADFEVLSGLSEGDEIAVTGIRQLRDGERVHRNGAGPE